MPVHSDAALRVQAAIARTLAEREWQKARALRAQARETRLAVERTRLRHGQTSDG